LVTAGKGTGDIIPAFGYGFGLGLGEGMPLAGKGVIYHG